MFRVFQRAFAAVAFTLLEILYATTMARGRVDWMMGMAARLAIVGALFLWSWRVMPCR